MSTYQLQEIFYSKAPIPKDLEGAKESPKPVLKVSLGWRFDSNPVDEGAGLEQIQQILAPALVQNYHLTFLVDPDSAPTKLLHSGKWVSGTDDSEYLSLLPFSGVPSWLGQVLTAFSRPIFGERRAFLVHTKSSTKAQGIFESRLWYLGSQIVFLTSSSNPPEVTYNLLNRLWQKSSVDDSIVRQVPWARGILLPGHNGDWAELFLFDSEDWPILKGSLERQALLAGVPWREYPPEEFLSRLQAESYMSQSH